MADQPIEVLRQAAAAGDPLAMTRLGRQLLRGSTTAELSEAASALDRATRAGEAEAPAILAMLFAMGVAAPRNLATALDLLRLAAERGSDQARGQLLALAGNGSDTGFQADDRWLQLRRSIAIEPWSQPPAREPLRGSPRVYTCPRFISGEVCGWIMARARGRVAPALVFDPNAPGLRIEDSRSNGAFEFGFDEMDVVLAMLRLRVAALVGVEPAALEAPQVLHYRVGQRFENHYDFFDTDLPGHRDQAARGQRTATCLIYLNADFDGGETDFPIIGLRHKAPAGGALCFVNVAPSGAPDRRTLHAGLAPTRGEKWLFSQWIRDLPKA
jgi:prolyl 4-hydroxylase